MNHETRVRIDFLAVHRLVKDHIRGSYPPGKKSPHNEGDLFLKLVMNF